ncbi:hypothetical protein OG21DRAFT_1365673, partial [Imleria badia]
LRSLKLSNAEWTVLEQLADVLKDATLFFSCSTPNLTTVIPAMDIIEKKLTTFARNRQYHPAIRAAVSLGKKTLNWYYSLMDSSEVYHIAMVLHPCHKLAYFKNANWELEWIDTAEALVREEF